jgi:MraZ protein
VGEIVIGDAGFLGEYEHALDDKGRLTVPSKFREGLGDPFIVTRGLDGCLFAYPAATWHRIAGKLDSLPFTASVPRAFTRLFFSGAVEATLDRQGRFIVPPGLRRHAGLEKDAVVIGVSSRVEIWSRERWNVFRERAEGEYQTLSEELFQTRGD